jgi:hypothetical protein
MEEAYTYSKIVLASEKQVLIRMRTYREWKEYEAEKIAAARDAFALHSDKQDLAANLSIASCTLERRHTRLRQWVKDFVSLQDDLTIADINEIERRALEMEDREIQQKN